MRRTGRVLAVLVHASAIGCTGDVAPNAEVVVVIDTDLPAPRIAGALRVDVFDESSAWVESRTIARPGPADWPTSFSLQAPNNAPSIQILRIRVYPTAALRDYRGEHLEEAADFTPPFVAHSIEELCASPPPLPLGEPLIVRAGRSPILGQLHGGDCLAWGTRVGSTAAFVDIPFAGTYRFATLATDPLWIDGNPGQVTLQLRESCADDATALDCDTGIINPTWTRAEILVDLQPGRYFLLTAGSHPDTAPRDIAIGAALASAWPAAWDDYRMPRAELGDPCAPRELLPTLPDGIAPSSEPIPETAVDQLVRIRLVPDERNYTRVTLRGACAGTMARLGSDCPVGLDPRAAETCIDTEGLREPLPEAPAATEEDAQAPSLAGQFESAEDCTPDDSDESSVCIPGGVFLFGSRAESGYGAVAGLGTVATVPERVTVMPKFWIDRYEMTVGRLRGAVAQGFDIRPEGISLVATNNGPLATSVSADARELCTWSDMPLGREDYPLACVSWYGARALCQFLGGDLPTEAEWEYVASAAGRSVETRYPWGDEPPDCDRAAIGRSDRAQNSDCYFENDLSTFGPLPVTARPNDATTQGVIGLGGSMSEWLLDAFEQYGAPCWQASTLERRRCDEDDAPYRSIRGNAWGGLLSTSYATLRGRRNAAIFDTYSGLRCKYEVRPP